MGNFRSELYPDGGPKLLQRAKNTRLDFPVSLVLAYQEYEAWFIAAADSLKGLRGLPETLETIPDPESIWGAKEWLSTRMPRYRPYMETIQVRPWVRFWARMID